MGNPSPQPIRVEGHPSSCSPCFSPSPATHGLLFFSLHPPWMPGSDLEPMYSFSEEHDDTMSERPSRHPCPMNLNKHGYLHAFLVRPRCVMQANPLRGVIPAHASTIVRDRRGDTEFFPGGNPHVAGALPARGETGSRRFVTDAPRAYAFRVSSHPVASLPPVRSLTGALPPSRAPSHAGTNEPRQGTGCLDALPGASLTMIASGENELGGSGCLHLQAGSAARETCMLPLSGRFSPQPPPRRRSAACQRT